MNSIIGNKKARSVVEQTAEIIFTICAFFAVLAVISITVYMFLNGTPALTKVGLTEILFSTVWKPTAADPSYGILYVILTSIVGTTLAILLGVPIGVLTAVFLAETAPKPLSKIVRPAIELLAGIPSVIYGLLVRQAPVQEVRLKSCWTSQMPAFTQTNWIPPVPLWQRLLPPPVRSVMFLSML